MQEQRGWRIDEILTAEQKENGFSLQEDENMITLLQNGSTVARWGNHVSAETIRQKVSYRMIAGG